MLFLNADIFETNWNQTEDRVETMFQVNYLSQFYLARLLMSNLTSLPNSRIVILSCESHR